MTNNAGHVADAAELAHRLAILELLFSHSRGLDRLDSACLKAAYWPEAEVDYGNFKGSAHQFAELVGPALSSKYELTQHSVSNTLIQLSGNSARCESCVTARHLIIGASEEMIFVGRYLDRVQLRDDCWKIMHRQVVMDWSRQAAVVDQRQSESFAALAKGGHYDNDPLYPFLNLQ